MMIIPPSERRAHRAAPVMIAMLLLAGCAQALPSLDPASSQAGATRAVPAASADAQRTAAPAPAADTNEEAAGPASPPPVGGTPAIIAFKGPLVTLYSGESSFEGERLAASSILVPIRARSMSAGGGRIEIATVAGPRWIDRSEVVMGTLEGAGGIRR